MSGALGERAAAGGAVEAGGGLTVHGADAVPGARAVYAALLADGPHRAGAHTAALDAGALAPGVYLWRVTTAHGVRSGRLVVVR